jgi:hypothetical protein
LCGTQEILLYLSFGSFDSFVDRLTHPNYGNFAAPGCTKERQRTPAADNDGGGSNSQGVVDLSQHVTRVGRKVDQTCQTSSVGKMFNFNSQCTAMHTKRPNGLSNVCDKQCAKTEAQWIAERESDVSTNFQDTDALKAYTFSDYDANGKYVAIVEDVYKDDFSSYTASAIYVDVNLLSNYERATVNAIHAVYPENTVRRSGMDKGTVVKTSKNVALPQRRSQSTSAGSVHMSTSLNLPECKQVQNGVTNLTSAFNVNGLMFGCASAQCPSGAAFAVVMENSEMQYKCTVDEARISENISDNEDNVVIALVVAVGSLCLVVMVMGYLGYLRWCTNVLQEVAHEVKEKAVELGEVVEDTAIEVKTKIETKLDSIF